MSLIYPNETVKLYSGIKIDPNYVNTLRWQNAAAQQTFFHTTYTPAAVLTALSYQRVTKGVIRVQLPVGQLNTVNYMAFLNSDLNNKWFYAFVTRVEYVNNITSDIYYELDYVQSYYFDTPFLNCFVEREHVADDTRGLHTLNEPININALKAYNRHKKLFTTWYICLYQSEEGAGSQLEGKMLISRVGAMPSACKLYAHKMENAADYTHFQEWLVQHTSDKETVINMFLYPAELTHYINEVDGVTYWSLIDVAQTIQFPTQVDGYTPKNNKVLTYPFCYLSVDNGEVANIYKYEDFEITQQTGNAMQFIIEGCPTSTPTITLAPTNYKASGNSQCYEERLQMQQLPQVAFPIDSYRAWLAQTESTRMNKVISSGLTSAGSMAMTGATLGSAVPGIGTAAGAAAGALVGAITGAVGGMISNAYAESEAENMKNHVSGASMSSMAIAGSKFGYTFKWMGVRAEQAKVIDDFFTMFGYQVNEVKHPDIYTRPHWNYLKTNGCAFSGSAPAEAVQALKRIHDRGITYWADHSEIGNYSLNNAPV